MTYPLLLDYKGTLFGRGFVAEVTARGWLLATQESDGGWWLYGVNPGAIAADGATLDEAHEHLRFALREVMLQYVGEAATFVEFSAMVEEFFHASDVMTTDEWSRAVDRVRVEKLSLDDLPLRSAALPVQVSVTRRVEAQLTPADNVTNASLVQVA